MADRPRDVEPVVASARAFDLTEAIATWRAATAAEPAVDGPALEELEGHLRDSVERLESAGLTPEEAFLIGARRVGTPEAVGREFARLRPHTRWLDRALWALCGALLWGPISGFFLAASVAGVAPFVGAGGLAPTLLFVLAQASAFAASLALCAWLIADRGPRLADWVGARAGHRMSQLGFALVVGLSVLLIIASGRMVYVMSGWPRSLTFAFNYSYLIFQVLQIACLAALLVVLVRRRQTLAEGQKVEQPVT